MISRIGRRARAGRPSRSGPRRQTGAGSPALVAPEVVHVSTFQTSWSPTAFAGMEAGDLILIGGSTDGVFNARNTWMSGKTFTDLQAPVSFHTHVFTVAYLFASGAETDTIAPVTGGTTDTCMVVLVVRGVDAASLLSGPVQSATVTSFITSHSLTGATPVDAPTLEVCYVGGTNDNNSGGSPWNSLATTNPAQGWTQRANFGTTAGDDASAGCWTREAAAAETQPTATLTQNAAYSALAYARFCLKGTS